MEERKMNDSMQTKKCNKTIEYYNKNAKQYVKDTVDASMFEIRRLFLLKLKPEGTILDLGCGAGRDSKAFLESGYKVVMVDGSKELCQIASEFTGEAAICSSFQEYEPNRFFDGIWACSSLLHLDKKDLRNAIIKYSKHLSEGGQFYMSFKYGTFNGERNGRFFTDMDEDNMQKLMDDIPGLLLRERFITNDVRPGRGNERWINVIYEKEGVNR